MAASFRTTFEVNSPNVRYTDEAIVSKYVYESTRVVQTADGKTVATPVAAAYEFKTERKVPRVGMMIVGLGGNNGTTVTAGVIANREGISWRTRKGIQEPNYLGSLTQASTLRLGVDERGNDVYIPFTKMLPMVHPNDLVIGGWDINSMNLADAMDRAQVLEPDLQRQVYHIMKDMVPLPSIYFPHFIAANQAERANNVLEGSHEDLIEHIRKDMRNFKAANSLDKVIVLWSANTERFAEVRAGLNDTAVSLMASIKANDPEVSPSTLFAIAAILEGAPYINGSPQNTFVPGVIELAEQHKVHIAGDDFKSGQTKMKSVLVDFLISAGIKPESVVSYNHLGNNDGRNLSAPAQFRSKEISKSSVVDDMVASNPLMYKDGEHPDHTVVIKYVPFVGDSKRALDEYSSSIFLGGQNTITMANVCEDSLLAAPLMLDLVILMELMTRMAYKAPGDEEFQSFNVIASLLSYLLKAPLVPYGTPVINALFRQRMSIENLMRVATGLPVDNFMQLEQRTRPELLYPDAIPASVAVAAGAAAAAAAAAPRQ